MIFFVLFCTASNKTENTPDEIESAKEAIIYKIKKKQNTVVRVIFAVLYHVHFNLYCMFIKFSTFFNECCCVDSLPSPLIFVSVSRELASISLITIGLTGGLQKPWIFLTYTIHIQHNTTSNCIPHENKNKSILTIWLQSLSCWTIPTDKSLYIKTTLNVSRFFFYSVLHFSNAYDFFLLRFLNW